MRLTILALSATALLGACHYLKPAADTTPDAGTATSGRIIALEGGTCAGIAAIQCADGLVCIMDDGACHSIADAAGTCQPKREYCTREYMPVCGCDGETYGNTCEAHAAGVSVDYKGECPPSGS